MDGMEISESTSSMSWYRENAWDRGVSGSGTPQPPDRPAECPTPDVSINLSRTATSTEAAVEN